MRYFIIASFLLLVSCFEKDASELFKAIELRQPVLVKDESGQISMATCAIYHYKEGLWKLKGVFDVSECDLVLGLNWSDFKRVQLFIQNCRAKQYEGGTL